MGDSKARLEMSLPSEADVRAELDRVVGNPPLNRSPQLANFLRFVTEAVVSGGGSRLKAYTIATGTLGRDNDFDPQVDPIVRVEAVRLRRALKHYYAHGGCNDPLVIALPRGSYVPVFHRNTAKRRGILSLIHRQRQRLSSTLREHSRLILLIVAIATTLDILGMFAVNAFRSVTRVSLDQNPIVSD
jgi:hypothetical protein